MKIRFISFQVQHISKDKFSNRQISFTPLGELLGIPSTTFAVLYFAAAVIGIYFAFIFGSTAAIGLISYFGISAAQEIAYSQVNNILAAAAGGNRDSSTGKLNSLGKID